MSPTQRPATSGPGTAGGPATGEPTAERTALVERLHRFADELRARGIPVSMVERIDAMRAVADADLADPLELHVALQATLIKSAAHLAMFDEVFALYFQLTGPLPQTPDQASAAADESARQLQDALHTALLDGSPELIRLVAEQAVTRYSRFDPGRPAAGIMYQKWTEEGLRLTEVTAQLTTGQGGQGGQGGGDQGGQGGQGDQGGQGGQDGQGGGGDGDGDGDGDQDQGSQGSQGRPGRPDSPDPRDIIENAESLRARIREAIRRRLVADRGVDAIAKTLRAPLTADLDISAANRAQLAQIEALMLPLQHKLATTMLRKRRRRTGPLDVRATVRASMATGGVPLRVVHRRPHPTKPQLFVLADMSGSVATYAAFTVSFVSAMSQLFSRIRTFAFAQSAVEVTAVFDTIRDPQLARKAIGELRGPFGLSPLGTYTDYGRSLRQFFDEVGSDLGRRSTVLIFGDGRGNYLPSEEATLVQIARRAGRVYWLNPEPKSLWGTGDSMMANYQRHCTEAVSCRSLNDLRRFIERMDSRII